MGAGLAMLAGNLYAQQCRATDLKSFTLGFILVPFILPLRLCAKRLVFKGGTGSFVPCSCHTVVSPGDEMAPHYLLAMMFFTVK
jgi:hypothetical protein